MHRTAGKPDRLWESAWSGVQVSANMWRRRNGCRVFKLQRCGVESSGLPISSTGMRASARSNCVRSDVKSGQPSFCRVLGPVLQPDLQSDRDAASQFPTLRVVWV